MSAHRHKRIWGQGGGQILGLNLGKIWEEIPISLEYPVTGMLEKGREQEVLTVLDGLSEEHQLHWHDSR